MTPVSIAVRTTTFFCFFSKPLEVFVKPKPGTLMHICTYLSNDFFHLEVFYKNRNGELRIYFLNWEGKDANFY